MKILLFIFILFSSFNAFCSDFDLAIAIEYYQQGSKYTGSTHGDPSEALSRISWNDNRKPKPTMQQLQNLWQNHTVVKTIDQLKNEAINSLIEKFLENSLNDPNAPQAVKDYKNAIDQNFSKPLTITR